MCERFPLRFTTSDTGKLANVKTEPRERWDNVGKRKTAHRLRFTLVLSSFA